MLGAIAGDIIGSAYEWRNVKTKDFPLKKLMTRFTDDTVLTVAIADAHLHGKNYIETLHHYYWRYPLAGYGKNFTLWATLKRRQPYNSWGNGSAMRVSPVAYVGQDLDTVLELAKASASVTHNHPEGIKGAQSTAAAIFLARTGTSKEEIKTYIQRTFGYNLDQTLDEIRPHYQFDVSCQGSVPQAIIAFLESTDFEDAIRNAISIGGDSDTIACITGGIAEAFYGEIPDPILNLVRETLDEPLWQTSQDFRFRFCT
ncbi:ADP-ribosylglycohydrolase family protein [Candidatus Synechococcus calcipolaris G9]|uniref:ADP-ribosylglycohydrolase family protein n=1 Tax=Candidatus Synechococcus calcipolaris G9 TaxID=1497997 RepID=A0ABT6EY24_9SYNE|nr:ADP-ribosylglycohydrolase family protein [Candidatus Synechococcus calcipolaris]MDG2990699.1 ADP-ribosylglycohydrolase family protein [Candidatus Synechococcus calcipolaris G9]